MPLTAMTDSKTALTPFVKSDESVGLLLLYSLAVEKSRSNE